MELNHFAYRIAPGSLEFVFDLFEQMNCSPGYKDEILRWGLVRQGSTHVQFIESGDAPLPSAAKENSHIGFLSADPAGEVERIREWAAGRGHELVVGGWSDKEYWFDIPDVFVEFVVEVMQASD